MAKLTDVDPDRLDRLDERGLLNGGCRLRILVLTLVAHQTFAQPMPAAAGARDSDGPALDAQKATVDPAVAFPNSRDLSEPGVAELSERVTEAQRAARVAGARIERLEEQLAVNAAVAPANSRHWSSVSQTAIDPTTMTTATTTSVVDRRTEDALLARTQVYL